MVEATDDTLAARDVGRAQEPEQLFTEGAQHHVHHALGGRCISTPCVVGGCIYIGDAAGTFYCFGP